MEDDHRSKTEKVVGDEQKPCHHECFASQENSGDEEEIADSVNKEYSEEELQDDIEVMVHIVVLIEIVHVLPSIRGCALVVSFFIEQEDASRDQYTKDT